VNLDYERSFERVLKSEAYAALLTAKSREWAQLVPGQMQTYIYKDDASYHKGYREAWKAHTFKKAGWDCYRHVEIICNGAIPVFRDSVSIPTTQLVYHPKKLLRHIERNQQENDPKVLAYYRHLLLEWGREFLSAPALVRYMATLTNIKEDISKPGAKVLFIDRNLASYVDYMSNSVLAGLVELLGYDAVDIYYPPYYMYKGVNISKYENRKDMGRHVYR